MPRKSPFRHDVDDYTREDGTRVETYKRGKGTRPKTRAKNRKLSSSRVRYATTFFLPSGAKETYIDGGTVSGALRSSLSKLQRPEFPTRAVMRRITR